MSVDVDPGVTWLCAALDPSVRYLTLVDVLGRPAMDPEVRAAAAEIPSGPRVRALLTGQRGDGGFGSDPYMDFWGGTHWRLISLAHLACPGNAAVEAAVDQEFRAVLPAYLQPPTISGRVRMHACVVGNALGAAVTLGFAADPRVRQLVELLVSAQWPDGGWNADRRADARTSSFWETHEPLWGLWQYHVATGDVAAADAAFRAAEFFLCRRLFRSRRTGKVIEPHSPDPVVCEWTTFHHPLYWCYDVLLGLDLLRPMGLLGDIRAAEALDLVESLRRADGTWEHTGTPHWRLEGDTPRTPKETLYRKWPQVAAEVMADLVQEDGVEVVDWGRSGPNEMITLRALRVLAAAGRLG